MSPLPGPALNTQSSKVQSILDIASHLLQTLLKFSKQSAAPSTPDLSVYLKALPLNSHHVSTRDRLELNKSGVGLWNTCTKLGREDKDDKQKANIAKARAFAYLLLDSGRRPGRKRLEDTVRLLRNALTATKNCLDVGLLDLSAKLLDVAASHYEDLHTDHTYDHLPDLETRLHCSSDFLLLRLALAWRQDRIDLADHFYGSIETQNLLKTRSGLENCIDLLYEIGRKEYDRRHYEVACRWLRRACAIIEEHTSNIFDPEYSELCLNIQHTCVRSLLALEDPDAGEEAHRIIDRLRQQHGHKLAVVLLQLEILSRDPFPNADAFFLELDIIARSVHLIESNFKMIMHYVHHLKSISEPLAGKVLRLFITQRLIPHGNTEWTESAIVTFIWMATVTTDEVKRSDLSALTSWLDEIQASESQCLTPEATHGALVLIWKQIEAAEVRKDNEQTIAWCRIALHPLFENAGAQNIGKVERKILGCHLRGPDLNDAHRLVSKMSQDTKAHRLSRFLSYTLAIRSADEKMAQQSLNSLAALSDDGNRLLLACVSETMQHGSKRQGARLLQRIIDKSDSALPAEVDSGVLLRCTARLLMSILEEESRLDAEILERLSAIFRAAARCSTTWKEKAWSDTTLSEYNECEWFSKIGYNFALRSLKKWPTKFVVDILQYTAEIQFQPDLERRRETAYQKHSMQRASVYYIQAVLYISKAREATSSWSVADIPRTSYQSRSRPESRQIRWTLYKNAFDKFTQFNQIAFEQFAVQPDAECEEYFQPKQTALLPLAFEAILHLGQADQGVDELSLVQIIEQASKLAAPAQTFAMFADMILSAATVCADAADEHSPLRLPVSTAVMLLRRIISAMRSFASYDIAQASRWIRCVVQLLVDPDGLTKGGITAIGNPDAKLLEEVCVQALALARSPFAAGPAGGVVSVEKASDNEGVPYPADELEWLSATLFNLAVDFYVGEREEVAKEWARRALEVADVLTGMVGGDGGVLARVLREKMVGMDWL